MALEHSVCAEFLVTQLAAEWLLTGVDAKMRRQIALDRERLTTLLARVWPLASVGQAMTHQVTRLIASAKGLQ